jgi:membrane protein YdbS with pleckstrin-like domain
MIEDEGLKMTENNIEYQARLHWIIFLWPVVFLLCLPYFSAKLEYLLRIPSFIFYVLLLVDLLWIGLVFLTYLCSSLVIKKKQVILCTGIVIRQTIDIPMMKIESIDIRQTILGSLLQYGSLVITGTGGTRQVIDYLNKPLTCRRYIEQMMHD